MEVRIAYFYPERKMETSLRYGEDSKALRIHAKQKLRIDSNTYFQVILNLWLNLRALSSSPSSKFTRVILVRPSCAESLIQDLDNQVRPVPSSDISIQVWVFIWSSQSLLSLSCRHAICTLLLILELGLCKAISLMLVCSLC